MNTLYEISPLIGSILIYGKLAICIIFVVIFIRAIFTLFDKKYRWCAIIPLFMGGWIFINIYSEVAIIDTQLRALESGSVSVISGELRDIYKEKDGAVDRKGRTIGSAEHIQLGGRVLIRISPDKMKGAGGCKNGYLKDDLIPYLGKLVNIYYIEEVYEDYYHPIFCILKIEVSEN